MTSSVDNLRFALALDPRIDPGNVHPLYAITKGARQVTGKQFISNNVSNSAVSFTCPPPSTDIYVDPQVLCTMTYQFTFSRASGSSPIFGAGAVNVGKYIAPRAYPIHQTVNTMAVTLNNSTITANVRDYIEPLLRYNNETKEQLYLDGLAPTEQDQSIKYSDLNDSIRSPLLAYGDSINNASDHRGGFAGFTVLSNTNTEGVIQLVSTEPLMISPLTWGEQAKYSRGFIGLTTFDVILTMGDLSRALSIDSDNYDMTGITITPALISGAQILQFQYLTPLMNEVIHTNNAYPLNVINRYPTDLGTLASNTSVTVSSSNFTLRSVPKRFYIYARPSNNISTYDVADFYANISNVNVNFNNLSGQLSSFTEQQLYNMSAFNGLKMSWNQWHIYCGSVLCVDTSRNLSLDDTIAPGSRGQFQFQVNVTLKNLHPSALNYTLYVITSDEGVFSIDSGLSRIDIGIVGIQNILQAPELPRVAYHSVLRDQNFYGGSFLDSVKKGLRKTGQFIHDNLPKAVSAVKKYGPAIASTAAKVAPLLLALGIPEHQAHRMIEDGTYEHVLKAHGMTAGSLVGNGMTAGRIASKNKLYKRIKKN